MTKDVTTDDPIETDHDQPPRNGFGIYASTQRSVLVKTGMTSLIDHTDVLFLIFRFNYTVCVCVCVKIPFHVEADMNKNFIDLLYM